MVCFSYIIVNTLHKGDNNNNNNNLLFNFIIKLLVWGYLKLCSAERQDIWTFSEHVNRNKIFFRRTAGHTLFDHKRQEEVESRTRWWDDKKIQIKLAKHVKIINEMMTQLMLNYRPRSQRRLGRLLKGLLDGAETGISRSNCWRVVIMMMMMLIWTWKEAVVMSLGLISCNHLMFFWPCIMNWLYINYQFDALISIYS